MAGALSYAPSRYAMQEEFMMQAATNVSPDEIARFGKLAARWWDPDGESRPLHDLNPVRAG